MKVNSEGRLTIPMELRKKHRITKDTELEAVNKEGEGILIRPVEQTCIICKSTEKLHRMQIKTKSVNDIIICEECITNLRVLNINK